ncbi:hypothetical protein BAUCODRAFT_23984 [Baudoinia panamericana UAMH 10762]|uniref:Uncharacterized protein n=1 Tax=Baudoinia panamericana (strain UAMH 10762) TaxID=717646 RepID=M2NB97_BAUPA|nr:uncharacterized protein BAUCODRAFT_23984 [Baudoinia panamericana UAMH 10762]EMC96145.1 hypothetical protein BAUCODRAFT_23984 [Baudoinia panamericana UAMH 10762]
MANSGEKVLKIGLNKDLNAVPALQTYPKWQREGVPHGCRKAAGFVLRAFWVEHKNGKQAQKQIKREEWATISTNWADPCIDWTSCDTLEAKEAFGWERTPAQMYDSYLKMGSPARTTTLEAKSPLDKERKGTKSADDDEPKQEDLSIAGPSLTAGKSDSKRQRANSCEDAPELWAEFCIFHLRRHPGDNDHIEETREAFQSEYQYPAPSVEQIRSMYTGSRQGRQLAVNPLEANSEAATTASTHGQMKRKASGYNAVSRFRAIRFRPTHLSEDEGTEGEIREATLKLREVHGLN